jgi:hypothetical protein
MCQVVHRTRSSYEANSSAVVIKKDGNRRLYDTAGGHNIALAITSPSAWVVGRVGGKPYLGGLGKGSP